VNRRLKGSDYLTETVLKDDRLAPTVSEHECCLRGFQTEIEGNNDGTDLGYRKVGLEHLIAIIAERSNPVSFADSLFQKGIGKPVHPLIEFSIGKRVGWFPFFSVIFKYDGRVVSRDLAAFSNPIPDVHDP
jgi:hypothetical protein